MCICTQKNSALDSLTGLVCLLHGRLDSPRDPRPQALEHELVRERPREPLLRRSKTRREVQYFSRFVVFSGMDRQRCAFVIHFREHYQCKTTARKREEAEEEWVGVGRKRVPPGPSWPCSGKHLLRDISRTAPPSIIYYFCSYFM